MEAKNVKTKKGTRQIYRGEIYYAKLLETVGSEQKGNRPVVVVQNDIGNVYSPTTIVLPFTKRLDIVNPQPTHIDVKQFGELKCDSTILAEQIRTIDKKRLGDRIGKLTPKIMEKLDIAMKIAIGIKK